MRRLSLALAVVVAAVTGLATVALGAADDQATADAAIAAFNERATAAGWVSEGPAELDEESPEDDIFSGCAAEFASVDAIFTGEFDGATARAYSDQFTFSPEGTQPATTGLFEFALENEEFLAAFVITVDEEHAGELERWSRSSAPPGSPNVLSSRSTSR